MRFPAFPLAALSIGLAIAMPREDSAQRPSASVATDSAMIVAAVDRYIAAMGARDTAYLRAAALPTMTMVAITSATGAISTTTLDRFLSARAGDPRRFTGRIWAPAVALHGPIAILSAPYDVRYDGVLSHCGIDHYVMARDRDRWLVSQVIFTRRTEGCDAPG